MTERSEQRICIKFCLKLEKSCAETIEMMKTAFGDECMSKTQIKEWYKRFKDGRTSVDSNSRSGRPSTTTTPDNIERVRLAINEDRRLTVRELECDLGISKTSVWKILTLLSLQREMPRTSQRVSKAKADSSKAKPGKKTEKLDENGTSSKKRVNDTNNEPASKRTKVDSKASKSADKSEPSTTKKTKNEPKQMLNKTDTNLDEIDFGCVKTNEEGKEYNLKICTWNVSGVRAVIKKNGIDYIIKEDADIIALQETKCDKDKMPDEVKLPGYHHYFLDSKKSGYCGVALFSKEKPISVKYGLNDSNFDSEGRMITAEFPEFFVINVYVPNAGQKLVTLPKRLEWNKTFKKCVEELDQKKPVIICGDMNVAHQEIDLKNPKTNTKNAGFTKEERDDMTDFLAAGFIDTFRLLYPETEGAYTFWSYFANARSKNIGWRLDYFLASERIKNKVCDNVIRKQVYGSDHCPIILYINL